jgi:hypothetical protein
LRGKRVKEEWVFFSIYNNIQTIEFKHEFEFNHSKTMLKHACNNKLLYFIIKLRKMIKCLEDLLGDVCMNPSWFFSL